jgi:hypothetical protein
MAEGGSKQPGSVVWKREVLLNYVRKAVTLGLCLDLIDTGAVHLYRQCPCTAFLDLGFENENGRF